MPKSAHWTAAEVHSTLAFAQAGQDTLYFAAVPPKDGERCAFRVPKSEFETHVTSTVIPRNHSDPGGSHDEW